MDLRHDREPGAADRRRVALLDIGIRLAKEQGYQWVTRESVAAEAKLSAPVINLVFGTVADFKREILREAVRRNIPEIVAQGLADRHAIALNAPDAVKQAALSYLSR